MALGWNEVLKIYAGSHIVYINRQCQTTA